MCDGNPAGPDGYGGAMAALPPNHHADYPQFTGAFGYLAGLTMIIGRGADARLVARLADLGPGDRVVDIGCGPGTAVRNGAAEGVTVTGVDPSEPMLRLARLLTRLRRPAGAVRWMAAGAEEMGLPDGSADVCWSIASVHHWPDLDGGISEVRRVLAPGGRFIAIERRSAPGATGTASHGWTADQAERLAALLLDHGFTSADVDNHDLGRRRVVAVTGRLG